MVEYGQGVGQVSGGGGLPGGGNGLGGPQDLGAQLATAIGDAGHQVAVLPLPAQLLLIVGVVVLGFWVLKQVF